MSKGKARKEQLRRIKDKLRRRRYMRKYMKKYRKSAIKHLHENFHTLMRYQLKWKVEVPFRWEQFLGYNVYDLARRLKKMWKPGMSWRNYGRIERADSGKKVWNIDHIQPASSFNFSHYLDKQFLECWKLSNIQPLWDSENKSKFMLSPEEWEKKKNRK